MSDRRERYRRGRDADRRTGRAGWNDHAHAALLRVTGLLISQRDRNGHRTYGEDDLRLLRQIRMLQAFGFGLEETRPFVECLRAGNPAGDACPASLEVYRSKLAELENCIAQLSTVRDAIRERLAHAEAETAAQPLVAPPEPRCELASHITLTQRQVG